MNSVELATLLDSLTGRIRQHQAASHRLEDERRDLIAQAFAEGWTHQQLADATGLSRGRIAQLKPR